jgi:hypothetical protein
MDFKRLALQGANQLSRFVGGNSSGDTHGYTHGSIVERFEVWSAGNAMWKTAAAR